MSDIHFFKTDSARKTADSLSSIIQRHLDKKESVVWLISGGSAAEIAVLASKKLRNVRYLSVALVDERYGPPHHSDSNELLLSKSGFATKTFKLVPVLTGNPPAKTRESYESRIKDLFNRSDYKIALLGIGPDGHTAGILPHSEAVESKCLVSYYETPEYNRLTLTPKALLELDEVVVYALGESKRQAIEQLGDNLAIARQPAQVLKYIPKVSIFNDIKGEAV